MRNPIVYYSNIQKVFKDKGIQRTISALKNISSCRMWLEICKNWYTNTIFTPPQKSLVSTWKWCSLLCSSMQHLLLFLFMGVLTIASADRQYKMDAKYNKEEPPPFNNSMNKTLIQATFNLRNILEMSESLQRLSIEVRPFSFPVLASLKSSFQRCPSLSSGTTQGLKWTSPCYME